MLKNLTAVVLTVLFIVSVTGCASPQKQQDEAKDTVSTQNDEEVFDNAPTAATKSRTAKIVKKDDSSMKNMETAAAQANVTAPAGTEATEAAGEEAQDKRSGSPIGIILGLLGVIAALLIIWFVVKKKKKDGDALPRGR